MSDIKEIREIIRNPRTSDADLCQTIKTSANIAEVMKKIYKNRAGAGSYERVAKLMKKKKLRFTNGNVYFNKGIESGK